jgi:hypothetical protein
MILQIKLLSDNSIPTIFVGVPTIFVGVSASV